MNSVNHSYIYGNPENSVKKCIIFPHSISPEKLIVFYFWFFDSKANEIGLTTSYFHFMFTTLDLSVLEFMPSANVTALQLFKLNDPSLKRIKALFDLKHVESKKRAIKYLPVRIILSVWFFLPFLFSMICLLFITLSHKLDL